MLARLADVVAAESARVNAPRYGGHGVRPGPFFDLRRAGRELDCSALPVVLVDGERGGFLTATLDRTVIVEYPDGWREPVRVDRVQIEAGDVVWRDAVSPTWNNQTILSGGDPESRARGRERAAQVRRERVRPVPVSASLPGIGTTEAAELAGVSTSTIHTWLTEGRLPCTVHVVGTRTVRRVLREDVLSMKKAPAATAASA